ncbi:hypothetical protein OHT59_10380 [Streptomyces sp. NBC_00243]|uniref:hypothetical protein n=1 Tax=Streptomyces sp. NBC_00243 TaxID=2975688 RepID=UPI002DD8783B|nr:hypothetical protein [Streptomyces sp. NBC_00243]WRZ18867.1 hypothetical protein OHT59_10380 [Streptomyces sp. NBC_00243]
MTQPHRFVTAAVSYLRVATGRYPGNAELLGLVDELLVGSEDFRPPGTPTSCASSTTTTRRSSTSKSGRSTRTSTSWPFRARTAG